MVNISTEVNKNSLDFNFPLCIVASESFYSELNNTHYMAVNVSELDSFEFIKLVNEISDAAIGEALALDEADWEIKSLCKYGNLIYLPFEIDTLGFANVTYQTHAGTMLFDIHYSPSSSVTQMLKVLADYIITND